MEYTLNIDELKEKIPEIFFNEWIKNKWVRIRLTNMERPKITTLKDTIYYIFEGNFEDVVHMLRLFKGLEILDWYHQQKYEPDVEQAKKKLLNDLAYFDKK